MQKDLVNRGVIIHSSASSIFTHSEESSDESFGDHQHDFEGFIFRVNSSDDLPVISSILQNEYGFITRTLRGPVGLSQVLNMSCDSIATFTNSLDEHF